MLTFFYFRRNPQNKSGISTKIWQINRVGKTVQVWWGPARMESRRPVPTGSLQTLRPWTFRDSAAAKDDAARRIAEKRREGYEPVPRRRLA